MNALQDLADRVESIRSAYARLAAAPTFIARAVLDRAAFDTCAAYLAEGFAEIRKALPEDVAEVASARWAEAVLVALPIDSNRHADLVREAREIADHNEATCPACAGQEG